MIQHVLSIWGIWQLPGERLFFSPFSILRNKDDRFTLRDISPKFTKHCDSVGLSDIFNILKSTHAHQKTFMTTHR